MCGNGSTELIFLLPRALKPRKVLIPYPTFSEYDRACLVTGARIKYVPMRKTNSFVPDAETFTKAMKGMDMAFLCNPGNPSGKALEREAVLSILKAAERERCVLVVDEAFMEFCPEYSVLGHDSPYLVVLRSLTKFYGLAGLRAGFAMVPKEPGRKLRTFKEPWTINVLAQRAAMAALDDETFAERTRKYIGRQKRFLEGAFRSMRLRFYPSDANYYLLESGKAKDLIDGLLERGIAVRDCSNFKGLGKSHFRVAVRSSKENALLVNRMMEILKEVT
jgi:threonine-phosphate decarboxylase